MQIRFLVSLCHSRHRIITDGYTIPYCMVTIDALNAIPLPVRFKLLLSRNVGPFEYVRGREFIVAGSQKYLGVKFQARQNFDSTFTLKRSSDSIKNEVQRPTVIFLARHGRQLSCDGLKGKFYWALSRKRIYIVDVRTNARGHLQCSSFPANHLRL